MWWCRVLRNAAAMTAEREALRMGIEHLTVLFPTEFRSFDFQVENSGRTVQYKLSSQSLRPFGLQSDVNDAHRAGANRLQNKTKIVHYIDSDICTPTPSLPCRCVPCCLFFFSSAYPQTDTAQLYNTHPDSCTHMDRTGPRVSFCLCGKQDQFTLSS